MFLLLPALFHIEGAGFLSGRLEGVVCLAILFDGRRYMVQGVIKASLLQFALPDNENIPSLGFQLAPGVLVALLVACYLGGPKACIGLGDRVIFAILVAVPETAVDEDDRAVLGEDDVRRAWEAAVVDAVAEAFSP